MADLPDGHYVYFGRSLLNPDAIKIGVSDRPEKRVRSLMAEPVAYMKCDTRKDALTLERVIHDSLAQERIHGEWFKREVCALCFGLGVAVRHPDRIFVVGDFYPEGEVNLGVVEGR